jgi:uncharacterized SAM-binding protein YcdF (DUF218 family)
VLGLVTKLLEVPLAIRDAPIESRDAIVVLGAPVSPSGELSPILAERAAAAIMLYRAGGGRIVAVTGGNTQHAPRAEADALADVMHGAGIPDVIVERESRNTDENARFTAALLAPLGVRTVWLVTQPFHGKRAARLFRRTGLEPRVWHIANSMQYRDRSRALRWLVREYVAWAMLAVRRRR